MSLDVPLEGSPILTTIIPHSSLPFVGVFLPMSRERSSKPTIGLAVVVLVTLVLVGLSIANRLEQGSYYDASGIWHRIR